MREISNYTGYSGVYLRLGFADQYAEERRQHKLLYDVYRHFIRNLHSKHDKLEEKFKKRYKTRTRGLS